MNECENQSVNITGGIMPNKSKGFLVPRNSVACSPILRKGGVHEKSKTAKRRQKRQSLNLQLDDWRGELEFERSLRSGSFYVLGLKTFTPNIHSL